MCSQRRLDPLHRLELDLDHAALRDVARVGIAPACDLRADGRCHKAEAVVGRSDPAFDPSIAGADSEGHGEIVEEFVGDDDAVEALGEIVEGAVDVVGAEETVRASRAAEEASIAWNS